MAWAPIRRVRDACSILDYRTAMGSMMSSQGRKMALALLVENSPWGLTYYMDDQPDHSPVLQFHLPKNSSSQHMAR
jgi:hypothetical protein